MTAVQLFVELIIDPHARLQDAEQLNLTAEVEHFIARKDVRLSPPVEAMLRRMAAVVQAQMAQGADGDDGAVRAGQHAAVHSPRTATRCSRDGD